MAKEGASYLEEVLVTRENLPSGNRDESQEMSTQEAAELIRDRFGAALADDVVLWDLMRKPIEKTKYVDNWGDSKTRITDRRTENYDKHEAFRAFVDTLPNSMRMVVASSFKRFAIAARSESWDNPTKKFDTIGNVRQTKIKNIAYMRDMTDESAQFLKTVFERPEPQG